VHFVNTRRERGVLLTFGTYAVHNVNRDALAGGELTKCTPTSPTQRS
jgi:hypothetical protein